MNEKKLQQLKRMKLYKYYADMEGYVDTIACKPYSHNLISILLRKIDKEYGQEEANETIDIFDLESLGYSKMGVKK